MNFYQITFNNTPGFDFKDIHEVVVAPTLVKDWWHYLPDVYIVETSLTSPQLASKITERLNGLTFLIIKVDIKDFNGVLTKDAWEWFSKKNKSQLAFKIRPNSPLPPMPSLLSTFAKATPKPGDSSIFRALRSSTQTLPKTPVKTLADILREAKKGL